MLSFRFPIILTCKISRSEHDVACLLQALARLRFSETVAQSDVDEALRLMQMSKYSLYSDDRQRSGLDAISDIYSILRDEAARTSSMDVRYAHALNLISRKVPFPHTHTGTSATSQWLDR